MATQPSPQDPSATAGPSIQTEGVFNVRSFGGYASTLGPDCFTRDGLLYRAGHLKDATPRGLQQIRDLGVSTIIDLTNSGETKALFNDKSNSLGHGVRVLSLPLAKHGFSVQQLSEKYQRYMAEGEKVDTSVCWYCLVLLVSNLNRQLQKATSSSFLKATR